MGQKIRAEEIVEETAGEHEYMPVMIVEGRYENLKVACCSSLIKRFTRRSSCDHVNNQVELGNFRRVEPLALPVLHRLGLGTGLNNRLTSFFIFWKPERRLQPGIMDLVYLCR